MAHAQATEEVERAGGASENRYEIEAGYARSIDGELETLRGGYAGTHSRVCNVNSRETLVYMRTHPDQWWLAGQIDVTADQVARMDRLCNVNIMGFQELRWML